MHHKVELSKSWVYLLLLHHNVNAFSVLSLYIEFYLHLCTLSCNCNWTDVIAIVKMLMMHGWYLILFISGFGLKSLILSLAECLSLGALSLIICSCPVCRLFDDTLFNQQSNVTFVI